MARWILCAMLLGCVGSLQAQPKKDPAAPPPASETPKPATPAVPPKPVKPDGPPEFELRFTDDSVVRAAFLDPVVVVRTKYGKLSVPITEIRRIDLGFRYPDGLEAKVTAAIEDLGASDFKQREAAEKALVEFRDMAIPALRRATKSPDKEVIRRAETLLKAILDKSPDERREPKDYDVIETVESTFQGQIETVAIKAKTKYFGEAPLKLAELRGFRAVGVESNEVIPFDVAKYGRPNDQTWMETTVEVQPGRPLEITATGQIDLWPQQGGQYIVGPNGQPQHGTGTPIVSPTGRSYQYLSGTLIGRIGKTGEPFVIGLSYKTARITTGGVLYLKMASPPWGNPASGQYKVTAKSGN